MIVIGYIQINPDDFTETQTVIGEYEVTEEGQDAFTEMIAEHSDTENVSMFFWGSRINPDEYVIVAYRDNED